MGFKYACYWQIHLLFQFDFLFVYQGTTLTDYKELFNFLINKFCLFKKVTVTLKFLLIGVQLTYSEKLFTKRSFFSTEPKK